MPRYNQTERDIIRDLQNRLAKVERRLTHLQNAHSATVHIQDKTDLPPSLTNGLIFVATDNEFCWVRNGVARGVSGSVI